MVVLIAPERDVKDEIVTLNQLFEAGLATYHLRKPNKSLGEHQTYLEEIDKQYHNRIMLHYHHELSSSFDVKGIHFQEQKRRNCLERSNSYFEDLPLKGKSMSSSFHELEELKNCPVNFDYHLLSPVFSSISKVNYRGRNFDVNAIKKTIIGMGGATTNNLAEFTKLGFKGVGVLGGIWNAPKPVDAFKKIQDYFKMPEHKTIAAL